MTVSVAAARAALLARIDAACVKARRPAGAARLVAVAKTQPDDAIEAAIDAGQTLFGENRVQEAQARWSRLAAARAGVELRLIGPLQSNKADDAVALFDVIETLDRPKLVVALAQAIAKVGRRPRLLVQVNVGEEAQKAGVAPADLASLLDAARAHGLAIDGLMAIPPADEPPGPHFALLAKLARRHGLGELSMGMSGDFETAIAMGATHVRLGTALFGARS